MASPILFVSAFFLFVDLCKSDNKKLYLLDLYTCLNEFEDYCNQIPQFTVRAAIELANSRDDILPGYTLSTSKKLDDDISMLLDGKVIITSKILDKFYEEVDIVTSQLNSSLSPIVLGSPFSFVGEYTIDILGKHQNFAQVSFKSTKLSNSPFFYRIGPNEAFFNAVRLELLLRNKWTRVGILSSVGTFSSTAEDLEQKLMEKNISVTNTASFIIEGGITDNVVNQLTHLKEIDIRVIIALITVIEVPPIMCKAYDIGLIDDHHVWILPEMNLNDIRRVAKQYNMCDVDIVLRNALMVGENYNSFENHSLPFGTNDLEDLLIKYNNLSSTISLRNVPGYNLSRVIFDATWAVVLALNNSLQPLAEKGKSLEESVNQNGVDQITSHIIEESLSQVNFYGLSGIVDFRNRYNNTLDKESSLMTSGTFDAAHILQIIYNSSCVVEIYKAANETTLVSDSGSCNYTWGTNPPTISDSSKIKYQRVHDGLLIFTIVASAIFILISVLLAMCNIALRKNVYLKTASLTLNIAIIFGCSFVFLSSIPRLLAYGAKQYDNSDTQSSAFCQLTFSFHWFGWNIICVFFLLKTWRLYRIQTNSLLKKRIRFISEKAIFTIMLIAVLPAVIIIILQAAFDRSMLFTESVEIEDELHEYSFCNSQYYYLWEPVLGIYNAIIIVCTLWQARKVSHMKIKKLALEGDISLRLLVILVIVTLCYAIIDTSIQFGDIDEEGIIFLTLESLSFPVIVLSMLYLPKAYFILKELQETRKPASKGSENSSAKHNYKTEESTIDII